SRREAPRPEQVRPSGPPTLNSSPPLSPPRTAFTIRPHGQVAEVEGTETDDSRRCGRGIPPPWLHRRAGRRPPPAHPGRPQGIRRGRHPPSPRRHPAAEGGRRSDVAGAVEGGSQAVRPGDAEAPPAARAAPRPRR